MMWPPAKEVARRVLDEEIERAGSWWDTENCWHVVQGEGIDQVTPVLEAAAARTGLSVERIKRMFRAERPLAQRGIFYATSHAHRKRRLAEGKLRLVDRKADPDRNMFHYCEPV